MAETHEYIEQLKKYADSIGGTFNYSNQSRKSMKRVAWSRVEILIPHHNTPVYFIAYSGNHTSDTFSGFFATNKLSLDIQCKISRKDPLDKLLNIFDHDVIKSSHSGFGKTLTVKSNNTDIIRKLSGKKSIRNFFELNLNPPLQFEITNNEKGYFKDKSEGTKLVALASNRWMVDRKQLNILLEGFKVIMDELNGTNRI